MPEVQPSPVVWRADAQKFRATPICRSCQEKHRFPHISPFCELWTCGAGKCENVAAYLAIY